MAFGVFTGMSPGIEGPECTPRTGKPPIFQVHPEPNHFYAVELATRAYLLNATDHASARTPATFFASWTAPKLASDPIFRLSQDIWDRLKGANKLYYRIITSASPSEWIDTIASLSDEQAEAAPSIQIFNLYRLPDELVKLDEAENIWAEIQNLKSVLDIRNLGMFDVLVYLHRYSPRRPIDPRATEWVVIVSHQPNDQSIPLLVSVIRLNYQERTLIADHISFHEKQSPVDIVKATEVMNNHRPSSALDKIKMSEVMQLGYFWVYSNQNPAPNNPVGCTLIVHRLSGVLVYASTTSWHGKAAHLIP